MIAQTNVALYNQLRDAGWTTPDLEDIHGAHEFLAASVVGRRTSSGKPFICHCVGVASVLVTDDAPLDIVMLGLLHAIHTHGDFGTERVGRPTTRSRRAVRQAVGDHRADMILGYDRTSWAWGAERDYAAQVRAGTMDDDRRQYIRVRVANDIDQIGQLGLHYRQGRQQYLSGDLLADLGEQAGWPELAARLRVELRALDADVGPGRVPEALWPSAPLYLTPRSWMMKPGARLVNAVRWRLKARRTRG